MSGQCRNGGKGNTQHGSECGLRKWIQIDGRVFKTRIFDWLGGLLPQLLGINEHDLELWFTLCGMHE